MAAAGPGGWLSLDVGNADVEITELGRTLGFRGCNWVNLSTGDKTEKVANAKLTPSELLPLHWLGLAAIAAGVSERAAAIAASHSKARDGGVVPVSATRARYVTKPRGARPGTVEIRKEVVFKVRPAAADLVERPET